MSGHKPWAEVKAAREELPDEWPPKRARSMEDWAAYWARQRWDRRFRHDHIQPFLGRWKRRLSAPRRWVIAARRFITRGRRGWAPSDTWGMDDYICRVIGEMTAHLKEHTHGHPCQGVTECWRSTPDNPRECNCQERWNETLDKISGPLLAYRTHWDEDTYKAGQDQKIIEAAQDALRLLADHLPSMWD